MDVQNDDLITIPDMNRVEQPVDDGTILSQSIDAKDTTYIGELLISENRYQDVEALSNRKKEELLVLLVEFLDHPLRVEAIRLIYHIINIVGDATRLGKSLIERSNDFNKLIHLKGKIDFLKHMRRHAPRENKPEHEYDDRD